MSPPTLLNDLEATYPYLSGADLVNMYKIAIAEYHVENTQLYHVVDTCVDLPGNHYECDIDHIKQMFHAQGSPVRDGRSYLQRIEAFNDCTSIAEQNKIQIQLANSNLVSGRSVNGQSAGFGERDPGT